MKITVIQNSMGHIHVFKGVPRINRGFGVHSNITKSNGQESDLYLQDDHDIKALKEYMTKTQRKDLENGWKVVMNDIGYFEGA